MRITAPNWTSERSLRLDFSHPHARPADLPRAVRAAADALASDRPAWLLDLIPGAASLLIIIDPLAIDAETAERVLYQRIAQRPQPELDPDADHAATPPRELTIDVCYDPDLAPDLAWLADHTGMSTDDVARLHASAVYTVACIGFSPGFPYLDGLPEALHAPRRAEPRPRVEAGSVAVAGARSCVYPQAMPGGWHVIGRTAAVLFRVERVPPARLAVGDRVRFRPVPREAIDRGEGAAW